MELVLYYIKESGLLIGSFLVLIFILGTFIYLSIRKFRQESKLKVMFYGLFMGLKSIDVLKLGIAIIRAFLVFYATLILKQEQILISIIMIIILSILNIIFSHKKIVFDIVYTVLESVMIYFIFTINNYMVEIETNTVIFLMKIILIIFTIIFASYMLLRDINLIVDTRWNKEFNKNRKEMKDGK